VAVVALAGATDSAWPLAAALYATPSLRPPTLDDGSARVLCGEPAPASGPTALRDLADSVAAVHGDDAPSRAILDSIARRFSVRALVVVRVDSGQATAQAYLPQTGAFDPARYAPEAGSSWTSVAQSIARSYAPASEPPPAPAPATTPAPALATHSAPPAPAHPAPRAFWQNGWFWGALGAAAFAGGAAYFITRDNTASTIHLEMQVPH
jgi:hypothetical protein